MTFERHHPNRQVDRNLDRARDLRSAYLFACMAMLVMFVARPGRLLRGNPPSPELDLPVPPIGKQPV